MMFTSPQTMQGLQVGWAQKAYVLCHHPFLSKLEPTSPLLSNVKDICLFLDKF